jgi:dTDP-4-amino-4,6-dideoxygalactose transaminase
MITKPIGGEFWYDKSLISEYTNPVNTYFLNGGRSSLACICRYLKSKNIFRILLPSYLCSTILDVFDDEKVDYTFYDINQDLSINIESIENNIEFIESIMFINYFGLSLNSEEKKYLISLKNKNKLLIEDKVHSLCSSFIGDIAFNSLRKFMSVSGSILQTKLDLEDIIKNMSFNLRYDIKIKKARKQKTGFIASNEGLEYDYLSTFKLAEELYYKQYSIGSNSEKELINTANFTEIKKIRNQNYKYLYNSLLDVGSIKIIFPKIDDKAPLGLPIYIDNDKRNFLVKKLRDSHIYLPVHWNLDNEERINNNKSKWMSSRMVTLVIDQRYDKNDMYRLAAEIRMIIG